VELDRPPVNALNKDLVAELTSIGESFVVRDDIWLVVVTSRQKVFSAGADLKERARVPDAEVLTVVRGIQRLTRVWGEIPQPVIMGVRGAVLGGGLEFALTADLLIASEDTKLGFPEVSLGILPAAGGTFRLVARASLGTARKWILTARHFSAPEALVDGVVDYVFPGTTFVNDFEGIVNDLSRNAPLSLRQAKQALLHATKPQVADGYMAELDAYAPLVSSADRKEALKAFLEKRRSNWTGA
jgi:enoyl-CoA hydratase/carnithine racemase